MIVKPIQMLKQFVEKMLTRLRQSIRTQLITTFFVCVLFGLIASRVSATLFENINKEETIDYSQDMELINWQAKLIAGTSTEEKTIDTIKERIKDENELLELGRDALKILVTDETGKVLYKTKQVQEMQIDLHDTISNVMSFSINQPSYIDGEGSDEWSRKEFITFYPLAIEENNLYMFVSKIPEGDIIYSTKEGPFPLLIGVLVFILSFFYMTRRKMEQIEAMAEGVKEIAKGDLTYRIKPKGQDEIALLTKSINHMAEELMVNIENERKFEKQKYALITNVSHDLRTPLTSIMGYLRLLNDGNFENKEQFNSYIQVAYSKSEQLKHLIEDLFEYTKLTDENIVLNREKICINKLLDQLIDELIPQITEHGLSIEKKFPDELLYSVVDSEQTVRLFDNLLMNAIEYSMENGEIMISMQKKKDYLEVSIANDSEAFTKEELENIFERFYKTDQSRSRVQEGSGLGLAIAKSIAEMQGGKIKTNYQNGMIQFIILLPILTEE